MGVVEVQYELMFCDDFFCKSKKMIEVKNFLKEVFEEMLKRVKKDFCLGDIIRVGIYNDYLDLLVFVFCCFMEEMDFVVILESLMIVFNSNEDIFFDFFC